MHPDCVPGLLIIVCMQTHIMHYSGEFQDNKSVFDLLRALCRLATFLVNFTDGLTKLAAQNNK